MLMGRRLHCRREGAIARSMGSNIRAVMLMATLLGSQLAAAGSILFIGNSFDYAEGSPVHFYRADTVTDLNDEGIGGVPALFKAFTDEAGLSYDVYLETHPGVGLD